MMRIRLLLLRRRLQSSHPLVALQQPKLLHHSGINSCSIMLCAQCCLS